VHYMLRLQSGKNRDTHDEIICNQSIGPGGAHSNYVQVQAWMKEQMRADIPGSPLQ